GFRGACRMGGRSAGSRAGLAARLSTQVLAARAALDGPAHPDGSGEKDECAHPDHAPGVRDAHVRPASAVATASARWSRPKGFFKTPLTRLAVSEMRVSAHPVKSRTGVSLREDLIARATSQPSRSGIPRSVRTTS